MPIVYLPGHAPQDDNIGQQPPEPPDRMEPRIAKLEAPAESTAARLTAIERDVAVMRAESSHFATKADVATAKNSVIMWVVSAIFLAQLLPALVKTLGL